MGEGKPRPAGPSAVSGLSVVGASRNGDSLAGLIKEIG